MSKLNKLHQYLPHHFLTAMIGKLASSENKALKNFMIKFYMRRFQINLTEALEKDINQYNTFNDFFARRLKPETRPIDSATNSITAPSDGFIYQFGKIEHEVMYNAKGFEFNLATLLGGNYHYANQIENGNFICMYLSPQDYHRVHMPYAGKLLETMYIPGQLFSVNPKIVRVIPGVFAANERLISYFETDIGPMFIIMVGATIVGSIHTVWEQKINRTIEHIVRDYRTSNIFLNKGDELGHFQLGSTVICLFPEYKLQWQQDMKIEQHKKFGEIIGTFHV